jgi:hypothetical protein
MNDNSYTVIFDTNRRFGNHFSSYLHLKCHGEAKARITEPRLTPRPHQSGLNSSYDQRLQSARCRPP